MVSGEMDGRGSGGVPARCCIGSGVGGDRDGAGALLIACDGRGDGVIGQSASVRRIRDGHLATWCRRVQRSGGCRIEDVEMGSRVPSGTGWWGRRARYPRAFLRWMDVRQSRDVFGASRGGLNGSHEAASDLAKKLRCRRCASRRVFYSRPMTTAACGGRTSRPSAWCVRTVVSTSLRHLPSIHRVDIARVTSRRELRSVFGREARFIFISQRKVPPTNSCAQLCLVK